MQVSLLPPTSEAKKSLCFSSFSSKFPHLYISEFSELNQHIHACFPMDIEWFYFCLEIRGANLTYNQGREQKWYRVSFASLSWIEIQHSNTGMKKKSASSHQAILAILSILIFLPRKKKKQKGKRKYKQTALNWSKIGIKELLSRKAAIYASTYHHSRSCRSCLGCHRSLVGLVLRRFDFGLQMCRRVKILAFLPHATTFYVIHTHGYGVVVCVNHCAVCRMCKAAISLSTRTVAPLELPAHLRAKQHWLQPETAGRAHVPPERTIPFPGEITESDLINPLCSSGRGKRVYFTLAHWAPQVALWYGG